MQLKYPPLDLFPRNAVGFRTAGFATGEYVYETFTFSKSPPAASAFDASRDASSTATGVGSAAGATRSTELMKSSRSTTDYGFGSTTG